MSNPFLVPGVLDCIHTVIDCVKTAAIVRPDDMLATFSELAVKEPDLMRLVLQASVAALVNVQAAESVDTELKRRAVNRELMPYGSFDGS